jgi:hypothetical protein
MLKEVVDFSNETQLPFAGMDELVRIILAPETLQMSIKIMGATRKDELATVEAFSIFADYIEQSCSCLVLIEGETSVHSQDGVKLKTWWMKKYKSWTNTVDKPLVEETPKEEKPVIKKIESKQVVTKSALRDYAVHIAVGSAVIISVIALFTMYKRNTRK